ncbi:FAD-dependent oxidoreductase [Paenibacillus allorhizosphaerae]|uniref:FAD-dependent oxidoreductase n=1 Tax=Paenibacillus allorhizosphaerae TaxID=2849866 RepID=A0ABM8VB08_9BACL|nr:FAD-dependent oxidoreductase [Paenibacillus allorhizosphaerae]CAG7617982.1 hypothetical protein PAECIP111802_00472 [Paenibacillus allorhizosphaerae]
MIHRTEQRYETVIYGATPGGIGAAVASARRGRKTALIEPSPFVGGLMTSGLGMTDIRSMDAAGSIFREFASKVLEHYTETYGDSSEQVKQCNQGLRFEPSVAKKVFAGILQAEPDLQMLRSCELISVTMNGKRIQSAAFCSLSGGPELAFQADMFIDATYEGDLAAMAGVPYSLGRESRDDWNEEFAGRLYIDFTSKDIFPGSTGEGDGRIQAYNFRLCLTQNKENQAPFIRPSDYRREDYVSLIGDVTDGRVKSIREVINIVAIPNGKSDTNNHHNCMCSTDLPEENTAYPEGSRDVREAVIRRHREYIQGLLWFLQNDEELPASFREEAKQWGYAADEFTETDHFPPQIYVREARRIHGEYLFTENDARLAPGLGRSPIQFDSIATGNYAIDSHAVLKREAIGQNRALEGFHGFGWLTEIYQIPYGIIVPQQVVNLLVPVAVSATHMGFGTIRMEPCWMQLGFAAGVAADLSIAEEVSVQQLCVDRLQDELIDEKQMITYFKDVKPGSDEGKAAQYFGTKGWFTELTADLERELTVAEASDWISRCRALTGGRKIPSLPATDRILPVGEDMGPRNPWKNEAPYREYWAEHPQLSRAMARRWMQAAFKAVGAERQPSLAKDADNVSRGEWITVLYFLLRACRK